MTTVRKLLASLLLICSTASYAADPDTREGARAVDVYLEGNETYRINDKSGSLDDLSRELKQSHAKKPISRINVRQGKETASAADVFKVVTLAKELGAAPFFEHDGVLKPINVQVEREVTRIDATSIESAEKSYSRMMASRSGTAKQQLALAVLALNMEGVKSAHDVVGNPELQSPGIARIRKKVEGLSAEEIISLAARTSSVRIEPAGR